MKKDFRILKLTLNNDDNSGLEMLIADLSEIEVKSDLGLSFTPVISNIIGEIFVFDPNSQMGQYILNEPEKFKTINFLEFKKGTINLIEGQKKAYYHKNFLERKYKYLFNDYKPSYSYILDNGKMVLADYYYKNKLSDSYQEFTYNSLLSNIKNYKQMIANNPNDTHIDCRYYNLACFLVELRDFESAKSYFKKSALQDATLSAEAYFALSCIKIKLNEDATVDLKKALELYQNQGNEYALYPKAILKCQNSDYNVKETFNISGKKQNGQVTTRLYEGYYSAGQIDVCFTRIRDFIKRELKLVDLPVKENGSFRIEVAFITGLPKRDNEFQYADCFNHISSCEISGFNYDEVKECINGLYEQIPNDEK